MLVKHKIMNGMLERVLGENGRGLFWVLSCNVLEDTEKLNKEKQTT
jgi:hypothetical protein